MKTIAERIREGMQLRNLKQTDLVEKTGISKGALSSYISGRYEPKQNNIYLISRALSVSEAWLMGLDVPPERNIEFKRGVIINVLNRISAEIPIGSVENVIDTEEISEDLAKTGTFFGLQIQGDSMEPRICDGDVVIVRQQEYAESGDIIIATVNGADATCRRLRKYRDGIELISNNPSYEPSFFSKEDIEKKPVKIIGKVVELRAKF